MGALTKAELEALVKRQQKSLDRAEAKNVTLAKSLDRAKTKNRLLGRSLNEAYEQQTATSEILRIISSSPTDTQPVFDAIVKSGARLFDGANVALRLVVGQHHETVASTIPIVRAEDRFPLPLTVQQGGPASRCISRREVVQVADMLTQYGLSEALRKRAEQRGYRAIACAPMMKESVALGAVVVLRAAPGPFSDKEIALLRTFADQAVIAIENVRLFNELQAKNAALSESLEQQTVTSEILRIISRSPTDTQPVFDAIVSSGVHLFEGMNMTLRLVRGNHSDPVASTLPLSSSDDRTAASLNDNRSLGIRAMQSGEVMQVPDVAASDWISEWGKERAARRGFRAVLSAPMMKAGVALGVINVTRAAPGPFTDREIALVGTFADQAVIAIENVRLFNELQAKNAELTEALEQRTATAEILNVISRSNADIKPVFDTIIRNAVRLGKAAHGFFISYDGDIMSLVAHYNVDPRMESVYLPAFPRPPARGSWSGRAVLDRTVINIPEISSSDYSDGSKERARRVGIRSVLVVPMLRDGAPIGVLVIGRREPGDFADSYIALLQTFADQAVIAIENVRLFKELQARNAEITEALEQQTATAEILKVISSSPTDLQPVFDVILENATRLCDAQRGSLGLFDGEKYEHLAVRGATPEHRKQLLNRGPRIPVEGTNLWRMISERRPIHVHDLANNPQVRSPVPVAFNQGVRTLLAVPMLKEGRVVGGIVIFRFEVRPFTQEQIDLVSTFASQAVIAIENVRLFKELQAQTEALSRSVSQLTALGEVGQAISSSLDLETVLKTIVSRALQLTGLDAGSIYEHDAQAQVFRLQATENMDAAIIEAVRTSPIRTGDGIVGQIGVTREVTQVPDILDASYQSGRRELLMRAGFRALLAVPLLREDQLLGVLLVHRKSPGEFAPEIVELLKTFAAQSALAIQNARLFREIAEKGRQLEVASEHKSQFLASMSHELRTPLNAMLGFNEMILGELYGPLPEELKEPLGDIQSSGKHLLRLINNVLDLAKIEAGRMELSLADYSVHDIVESVRTTLHPLAAEKGLEFSVSVAEDIPFAHGDFGRITQCLMNLAGNSLKFTREGSVRISVDRDGDRVAFRVADTGIGIAPDKIESLFTEFKQTDATIASEFGGTGLGLSITKKFVEMHGGRIWVESELGRGSAFIFEIPLRAGEEARA